MGPDTESRAPAVYRWALRLLPAELRTEFGGEMLRVAEEHWADVRREGGPGAGLRFWGRQIRAVVREACRLRLAGLRGRDAPVLLFRDLRYSARALLHRPGFTTVTMLTLGLGVGATVTMFTAVDAVLLRPLPYDAPERIVTLVRVDRTTGEPRDGVSAANLRDLEGRVDGLATLALADPWSLDLTLPDRTESLRGWAVSQGFFEVLGVQPELGRLIAPEEFAEGSDKVAVLGHRAWRGRFGGDPGIVGRVLHLDGEPHTVVGVLPPSFRFPSESEVWTPRAPRPWDEASRGSAYLTGIARLGPSVGLEAAQAGMDRAASGLERAHPEANASLSIRLTPLRDHLVGDVRAPLWAVMGSVLLVLLVACANVAGLLLARGAQRRREFALRAALGAARRRLMGQVAGETALLATGGAALALGVTYVGVRAIRAFGPTALPRIQEVGVDGRVLGFALLAALLSAVVSGLAPALHLTRTDLRGALTEGGRGSTSDRRGSRTRGRLVVLEVAGAVVLLAGAGLLLRSFQALVDRDLGFEVENRLAVQVFTYDYPSRGEQTAFLASAVDGILGIPGVSDVVLTSQVPGADDGAVASIEIPVVFQVEGRDPAPSGQEPRAALSSVSPRFFERMGIGVLEGREFQPTDGPDAGPVAVVNATLAERHFRNGSAVGRFLRVGEREEPRRIVGVVGDVRGGGHASNVVPELYLAMDQGMAGPVTFVVHAPVGAAAVADAVAEAIWSVNPAQSIWGAAPLETLVSERLAARRASLVLVSTFALVTLFLATVGLYGLISYTVELRRRELGIRRALGGRPTALLGMVVRQGLRLSALGTVLGIGAALLLGRFIQGMLFEVRVTDAATYLALAGGTLAVALLASLVPAVRALRIDPVRALGSD